MNPIDCRELLTLSAEQFETRFRNSPMSRPGRAGLLRNAAIVLGNAGDRAAEPQLIVALDDTEPLVRGTAAWALGRLNSAGADSALRTRLTLEVDETVRMEITVALRNDLS